MKIKKIICIMTAVTIAAGMSALSVSAEATNEPLGYVSMSAEKFVLGEGYICEPEKVPFYSGETGAEITERFIGAENINNGKGVGGYITSIKDENGAGNENIPEIILDACKDLGGIDYKRADEQWLSSYDYTSMSGWVYMLNNEMTPYGIGDYTPVDGDVIRWEYTIYYYGSDIGVDNSSWGGPKAIINPANFDKVTAAMAEVNSKELKNSRYVGTAYSSAIESVSSLTEIQDIVAHAYEGIENAVYVFNNVKYGDANNDSLVNIADAVFLSKHVASPDEYSFYVESGDKNGLLKEANADCCFDGTVNVSDILMLVKAISNGTVSELGK